MINLWLGIAALIAVAFFFIWLPVLRQNRTEPMTDADRNAQNVALFKTRLAELEKELDDNNLDQPSFDELKAELEASLLQDVDPEEPQQTVSKKGFPRLLPIFLSVLLPVAALLFYLQWGSSQPLAVALENAENPNSPQAMMRAAAQRIEQLKERLEENPEDPEAWFLLAHTFLNLERYVEANEAFAVITQLVGEHPSILSQRAQTLYYMNDNTMTPEAEQLVAKALELDPEDPSALGFVGILAFDRGEYREAIKHWETALNSGKPEVSRQGLQVAIEQARAQLVAQGEEPPEPAAVPDTGVEVDLSLTPQLASRVNDDTVVFLVAQAVDGPPMPLAAKRLRMADLPLKVVLDDRAAMSPQMTISSMDEVTIRAIVSFGGTAGAQPGDLMGTTGAIKIESGNIKLVELKIDQVVE